MNYLFASEEAPVDEAKKPLLGKVDESALTWGGRLAGASRVNNYIDVTATHEQLEARFKQLGRCMQALKPLGMLIVKFIVCLGPLFGALARYVYAFYLILPWNIVQMIFGVALCFFGGTYAVSIAAVEAFRTMGGMKVLPDLYFVWEQASLAYKASAAESFEDPDAKITVTSTADVVVRKAKKALAAVTEPDKLQSSAGALWSAWMAVLATLRFQFAQIIALALGAVDVLKFPVTRLLTPLIAWLLGPDLKQWIGTIIDTLLKMVVMAFAFYLQMIISAFYSGLRGGNMFAIGLFNILQERGILEKLPACMAKQPFNPNESYLDEAIAYPLAAAGFYFQLVNGFTLPGYWGYVFFPLDIVEWTLRWIVLTSDDPSDTAAPPSALHHQPTIFYT